VLAAQRLPASRMMAQRCSAACGRAADVPQLQQPRGGLQNLPETLQPVCLRCMQVILLLMKEASGAFCWAAINDLDLALEAPLLGDLHVSTCASKV
jgi:hypothetical protein